MSKVQHLSAISLLDLELADLQTLDINPYHLSEEERKRFWDKISLSGSFFYR